MTNTTSIEDGAPPPSPPGRGRGVFPLLVRAALPLGIVAAGWGAYTVLSVEPEKQGAPPPEARLLRTRATELQVEDFPPMIESNGVVRPHNEVTLTAQIPGKIIRIHPGFEDGAFFSDREVLVELDAVDYEASVTVAEAQVARAEAAFSQEDTRAKQAMLNWKDLGIDDEPTDLVLRKPQLREAKANVESSLAQLEQAKRDLERTKIRAPFDGRVRQRDVGLGQSVGSGTPLGTVFDVAFAEVRLPIAGAKLRFLTLPETSDDPPVAVELRNAINTDVETVWEAEIIRTEGTLDADSLELFAIARVDDPFGRSSGNPPLRIGQPVAAAIAGDVLTGAVAIPRSAVQQLDKINLIDGETLTLQPKTIEPVWKNKEYMIVQDPTIKDGALLSTTRLVYAPEGAKVEIIPEMEATDEEATEEENEEEPKQVSNSKS